MATLTRRTPVALVRLLRDTWGRLHRWSVNACDVFYPYRPRFRDWRFWAIQGLVLAIAATHTTLEFLRYYGHATLVGGSPGVPFLSFIPVSLFIIPVVWAALGFGLPGALATAGWCTLLTLPNFVLHPGAERARELWQMGLVDVMAWFVGQRVDREFSARARERAVTAALRSSELRFRGLFESSPVPVLVVNSAGAVADVNPAATSIFGLPVTSLVGQDLSKLVRGAVMAAGAGGVGPGQTGVVRAPACVVKSQDGSERHVQPILTRIANESGEPYVQVLLVDVTEERRRQGDLRALAARILRAQEEERRRIAQELHDETIQSLILLCRRLDRFEAESTLSSAASRELHEARSSAEGVVEGLRGFARVLRPPSLDELGLVAAIRRLTADAGERGGLKTRLSVAGTERRLPADAELCLFRIVQEALRNVERHARASSVTVRMTFGNPIVTLEITDNGIGFVPGMEAADLTRDGQLGLLGMNERAEFLGGQFEVCSVPGSGTTVTVSLPVAPKADSG